MALHNNISLSMSDPNINFLTISETCHGQDYVEGCKIGHIGNFSQKLSFWFLTHNADDVYMLKPNNHIDA